MQYEYDIGIIGGGVLGCSIAHRLLAHFPNKSVAIFERDQICSGCSGYAGAIISPIDMSEIHKEHTIYAKNWYRDFQNSIDCRVIKEISVKLVCSYQSIIKLRKQCSHRLMATSRLPVWLQSDSNTVVFEGATAMQIDPKYFCQQLIVNQPRLAIFECSPVIHYQRKGNHWLVDLFDGRTIKCNILILAKGAWLLEEELKYFLDFKVKKVISFFLDVPSSEEDSLIYFYDYGSFLLPLPQKNQWMLSITSEEWGCQPKREYLHANKEDRLLSELILKKYCPSLISQLLGASSHCDAYSENYMPKTMNVDQNLIVVSGCSGSGFRYAPVVANQILDLLNDFRLPRKKSEDQSSFREKLV